MADDRTYIRVHDGMPDHPKIDGLSDGAFRLLITMWCWCSRHRTDGRVKATTWRKRSSAKARAELITEGLAVPDDDGGVVMHDYLQHQRSAAEIAEQVEQKRRSGARGNHLRWHAERGITDPECIWCEDPVPVPPPPRNGSQVRSQTRSQQPSQPGSQPGSQNDRTKGRETYRETSPDTETDTERTTEPLRGSGADAPKSRSATTPTVGALALVEPPNTEPEPHLGHVVRAYVDGATNAGLPRPSERLRGKVGRDAKRLAEREHIPVAALITAAESMGSRGWDDLDRELQRVSANARGQGGGPSAARPSTTDQRVAAGLALAQKFAEEDQ